MYKKKLIFIALIILVLVAFLYYTSETEAKTIPANTAVLPQDDDKFSSVPSKIVKENITPKLTDNSTSSQIILTEKTEIHMYESLTLEEAQLTTKPRKHIQAIAAIQINREKLNHLKLKDTLLLTDIEGMDYPLTITNIQTNNDASVSTTGTYIDEGITYTTTMTLSENESFISLSTPKGLYEIETSNGVGYIYRTQDIRKQMQSSSINDVIILPIPKKYIREE